MILENSESHLKGKKYVMEDLLLLTVLLSTKSHSWSIALVLDVFLHRVSSGQVV